jgi:hypothetical protein
VSDTEEELRDLDRKLKQLKLDYERYFLGTRPREPIHLRGEVDKLIVVFSNTAIQNTGLRFKFNSLCSRYQAFRRQWNETLRKMEQGTYTRHRFKADLHDRERQTAQGAPGGADLFTEYRDARMACGQGVKNLSPQKLEQQLEHQRQALRQRYGDAEFRFRVVVEDGKAKVKARRIRTGASQAS